MTLRDFCGSDEFWNTSLLVNSNWPQLTDCFVNTVLVWVPCLLFLLNFPFYMSSLASREDEDPLPVTFLNIAKTLLSALLSLFASLAFIEDLVKLKDGNGPPIAVYLSDNMRLCVYICAAVLTQTERRRNVITSGVQFCFWGVILIVDIVPVYTSFMNKLYETNMLRVVLINMTEAIQLIQLILFSFSEAKDICPKQGYRSVEKHPCPESRSSFLNQLLFSWMGRYVYRGWRKDLTEEDLFHLNPKDTSQALMPAFEKEWALEKQRIERLIRTASSEDGDSISLKEQSSDISDKDNGSTYTSETEATTLIKDREFPPLSSSASSEKKYGSGEGEDKDETEKDSPRPSLFRVLFRMLGARLAVGLLQKIVSDVCNVLSPILLGMLVGYAASPDSSTTWQGYGIAVLMFVLDNANTLTLSSSIWTGQLAGVNMKTILVSAIYRKSLTMNNEARRQSCGAIVNLMSVDCERLQNAMNLFFVGGTAPLLFLIVIIVLYNYIGAATFVGLLTLLILLPLNLIVIGRQQVLSRDVLNHKDMRLSLIGEVLFGIKLLKFNAWEMLYEEKIHSIRKRETKLLLKNAYLKIILNVFWNSVPFLIILTTLATYVHISPDEILDAKTAFVTLAMFALLRAPLIQFAAVIVMVVQAIVSMKRINAFLLVGDLDFNIAKHDSEALDAVNVKNGTFTWEVGRPPILKNIEARVAEGSLVAVVGQVGSGKTSLISAMLGELNTMWGRVILKKPVAYVPQQAWIQNATVRDNILFGSDYEEERYNKVLHACALDRDLEILPAGDFTEIGEKGINLSGGQKQRVSLARAVYSNSDIVFLDDPLSAVDSHVGKHIFNKVLGPKGLLKHKTRVLVTHGLHWLPLVDEIWLLVDGMLVEQGSYRQLLSRNGNLVRFMQLHIQHQEETADEDDEIIDTDVMGLMEKVKRDVETATSDTATSGDELASYATGIALRSDHGVSAIRQRKSDKKKARKDSVVKEVEEDNADKGRLTEHETTGTGKVNTTVIWAYVTAAGVLPFTLALGFLALFEAASAGSNVWLSKWTDDSFLNSIAYSPNKSLAFNEDKIDSKNDYYLEIFTILGILQVLMLLISFILYWLSTVVASKTLHRQLAISVVRTPASFFDTTPVGRVLNRFSQDIEAVDNTLPNAIKELVVISFDAIGNLLVIIISTPLFLILAVPLLILFYFIQSFYIPTSRQLRRIESVTRSPIYNHFSETLSGGPSIRAYQATSRFLHHTTYLVDYNMSYNYANICANRWLSTSLRMVGSVIVLGAAFFAVITPDVSGGTVGLSVTYSLQLTNMLIWMVRQISDTQTNIVSVERIKEYTDLPPEEVETDGQFKPNPSWPFSGRLTFNHFCTRYRPGLPLVLKDVTFTVESGQKVAVVGRTGSGKSTLTLSLVRMMEAASGQIIVDGVNIADIGLHELRSKITVLSQDPILFSGSLRKNLDPLEQYSDENLWQALDRVCLKSYVEDQPEGLDYEVGEEGQNFSVGQRQLLCLARTLLRRTKIIVLDEATAAVDMETDSLIQDTIRVAFHQCTVLTIAHRLNTIMDYDRILVLSAGQVKEFDTPHSLLSDPSTVFYSMAREANLV